MYVCVCKVCCVCIVWCCMWVCICRCVYVFLCVFMCVYVCVCVYIMCVCMCMYVLCMCVNVCWCVCVCMYIHTHILSYTSIGRRHRVDVGAWASTFTCTVSNKVDIGASTIDIGASTFLIRRVDSLMSTDVEVDVRTSTVNIRVSTVDQISPLPFDIKLGMKLTIFGRILWKLGLNLKKKCTLTSARPADISKHRIALNWG